MVEVHVRGCTPRLRGMGRASRRARRGIGGFVHALIAAPVLTVAIYVGVAAIWFVPDQRME
jgi:hypothetical protein